MLFSNSVFQIIKPTTLFVSGNSWDTRLTTWLGWVNSRKVAESIHHLRFNWMQAWLLFHGLSPIGFHPLGRKKKTKSNSLSRIRRIIFHPIAIFIVRDSSIRSKTGGKNFQIDKEDLEQKSRNYYYFISHRMISMHDTMSVKLSNQDSSSEMHRNSNGSHASSIDQQ